MGYKNLDWMMADKIQRDRGLHLSTSIPNTWIQEDMGQVQKLLQLGKMIQMGNLCTLRAGFYPR